jgi:alpha-galactosidase
VDLVNCVMGQQQQQPSSPSPPPALLLFLLLLFAAGGGNSVAPVLALDNGVGLVPAAGWSSWNTFGGGVTADAVMSMADIMVEKGLDKLGYVYVGIDCGWNLRARASSGDLQPDPKKFPDGIKHVSEYVTSRGDGLLKLGIYSEHDTADCCGGPGMKGYEDQDAAFYKANGVSYLKVDSCAGHGLNTTTMYQDYTPTSAMHSIAAEIMSISIFAQRRRLQTLFRGCIHRVVRGGNTYTARRLSKMPAWMFAASQTRR